MPPFSSRATIEGWMAAIPPEDLAVMELEARRARLIRHCEALIERAATDGERAAAQAAIGRLRRKDRVV